MKTIITIILVAVVTVCYSQESIVHKGEGILTLKSGEEIAGKISYSPQSPNTVRVDIEGVKKTQKYKVKETDYFTVGEKKFYGKVSKGSVGSSDYFLEMQTPEDYPIQIYVFTQQSSWSTGGMDGFDVQRQLFIGLPGEDPVYDMASGRFMPSHKKLSKVVADCPTLAAKISSKEKGYYFPTITTDDVKEKVFKTVSEEYYNCLQAEKTGEE